MNKLTQTQGAVNPAIQKERVVEDLIQITKQNIDGVEVNSVYARDLHTALAIKRDFNAWMSDTKEILETYEEGVDYIRTTKDGNNADVVVKKSLKLRGKQAEYIMSLEMCKHIAMMSKSAKGREVRKYFIKIEKQLSRPLTTANQIQLLAQGHTEVNARLERLEETKRLENWQEKVLLDAKIKKVYFLAKNDKELANKLHRKIWSLFKQKFYLPRYNELPAVKFQEGIDFINSLTLLNML